VSVLDLIRNLQIENKARDKRTNMLEIHEGSYSAPGTKEDFPVTQDEPREQV
jgi:hypothetical protein